MSNYQISENMLNLGTENAFVVLARAAELERQGHNVINLELGNLILKQQIILLKLQLRHLKMDITDIRLVMEY